MSTRRPDRELLPLRFPFVLFVEVGSRFVDLVEGTDAITPVDLYL